MPRKAPPVPEEVAARLLADNRHRCCICCEIGEEKPVIIHHIDENPFNNDPSNLCVLCKPHHDAVHTKPHFARKYHPYEVALYKKRWERHCKLETHKLKIIINFGNLSDRVVSLDNPKFKYPFIYNVKSGTTQVEVDLFVNSTGDMVEEISEGALSAEEFAEILLKDIEEPEEE